MAVAQQFNLRWNNHTNNMLQTLSENYERESLVDVTLSCQGKFLKAHKLVLGACSPHFQDIFDHHDSPHPVIIMNGLKYEDIRSIVEFMYKGEVKVTEGDLESLLATAESLQVKGLSNVRTTRPTGQGQSTQTVAAPTSNQSSGSSKNSYITDLLTKPQNGTGNRSGNGQGNGHATSTSTISSPVYHVNPIHTGGKTQSTNESPNNHVSGSPESSDSLPDGGLDIYMPVTPMYLRRKRAKVTPRSKEQVLVNGFNESPSKGGSAGSATTSVEDENSNDLPLSIQIDPPFIRDIDEDDGSDSPKNFSLESSDGHRNVKVGPMEPKEKIPRPPNAFMIFANEWRRKLATQFPNESNKEISVRLGIMWKNLPAAKKEEYFAASRQANDDHKKKYPDYYYSPKEARMRKRWKLQQQQVNQMMTAAGQYNPVHLVKVYMNESEAASHPNPTATPNSSPRKRGNAAAIKT